MATLEQRQAAIRNAAQHINPEGPMTTKHHIIAVNARGARVLDATLDGASGIPLRAFTAALEGVLLPGMRLQGTTETTKDLQLTKEDR